MDKHELRNNIEEIIELVDKGKFKQASQQAMGLEWQKVKDWHGLSAAITAHEKSGELEEARDIAILAYNRNLGGKKLVYELTSIMTKLKQFDEADELFLEYEKMASRDVNRYILYYELRKAEGAPSNELVGILEEYKEKELDEKYMYELAKLYSKTNRKKECIKACDEIELMFQDGTYVIKALKMKQYHGARLTETQQQKLEEARNRRADMEITRELLFQQQMNNTARLDDTREAEIEEMLTGRSVDDTVDVGSMMEKAAAVDDDVDYTEFETELDENGVNRKLKRFILAKVKEADEAKKALAQQQEALKQAEQAMQAAQRDAFTVSSDGTEEADKTSQQTEGVAGAEATATESTATESTATESAAVEGAASESVVAESAYAEDNDAGNTDSAQDSEAAATSEIPESLKDLIANAKKKLESSYDKITKESEQEKLEQERADAVRHIREREDAMEIEAVAVPALNIYDTQNLQAEIAKNLSAVLEEEEEQDPEMFRPSPAAAVKQQEAEAPVEEEDEQIEGQMSLADWMESVREEKYGSQNTKEYSKSELERLLDQKEENSAAYEKLLEERKQNKANEAAKDMTQIMLLAAKTDLAIRTGKATQKLEEAVENLREAAAVAGEINNSSESSTVAMPRMPRRAEFVTEADEEEVTNEATASVESISLNTANIDTVSDEVLAKYVKQMAATEDEEADRKLKAEDGEKQAAPTAEVNKKPQKVKSGVKLDSALARYFKKYKEMPGIEEQIGEYFAALPEEMKINTSSTGNILITGNSSSDKYDLAKAIVRAINAMYPDNTKKIARTTGESINYRGISKAITKLRGTVLVIEGAGVIQPKRINEMLECMDQDTGRMIVILEDSDTDINALLNFNPDLAKKFNHRIVLKQYTVNELVEMAKKFARRRSYEVDDDALLELYLRIDKLHAVTDNIKLDDVKEIINQAIAHSEKRASRKLFKGIKKKHTDNGDLIYLTEADFKE